MIIDVRLESMWHPRYLPVFFLEILTLTMWWYEGNTGGGGGGGTGAGGGLATCPTSSSTFLSLFLPAINWASNALRIVSCVGSTPTVDFRFIFWAISRNFSVELFSRVFSVKLLLLLWLELLLLLLLPMLEELIMLLEDSLAGLERVDEFEDDDKLETPESTKVNHFSYFFWSFAYKYSTNQ